MTDAKTLDGLRLIARLARVVNEMANEIRVRPDLRLESRQIADEADRVRRAA